ncbi:NEDD4-binding protein 2-like 2, partial [Psammomys obesus]|uniref:NEDD4-binding protein 2-like 2 n=1 Tax=Psammomys obesus TaxID=48139 RepID=UPI0024530F35
MIRASARAIRASAGAIRASARVIRASARAIRASRPPPRALLGGSPDGVVCSADDYFRGGGGGYSYSVSGLGRAHDWSQSRAKRAIAEGRSPVIIDNTNTQAWEMRPYVEM